MIDLNRIATTLYSGLVEVNLDAITNPSIGNNDIMHARIPNVDLSCFTFHFDNTCFSREHPKNSIDFSEQSNLCCAIKTAVNNQVVMITYGRA